MKREIKFRGKKEETGEWVYGFFAFLHMSDPNDSDQITRGITSIPSIFNDDYGRSKNCWNTVVQKTVGQFTGFLDFYRKEIYEGDYIQRYYDIGYGNVYKSEGVVVFEDGAFGVKQGDSVLHLHAVKGWTVIGNIHDNPELMEGGAQ